MNDTMRQNYRKLTEAEESDMRWAKDAGQEFINFLSSLGESRELSLAKTKMEEAVMWAVKHITR